MSKTSQARDQANNPERTADAQERTAARIRIRGLDVEQADIRPTLRQTFLDITGLQHVRNVFRRWRKDNDGQPITTRRERSAARHAFQEERRKSVVRRRAQPVLKSRGKVYATMSNGQRIRLEKLQPVAA